MLTEKQSRTGTIAAIVLAAFIATPEFTKAAPDCKPGQYTSTGAATSRDLAARNAVLKLRKRAAPKYGVIKSSDIDTVCKKGVLWNCTATIQPKGCP